VVSSRWRSPVSGTSGKSGVLAALNPLHGVNFLANHGVIGLFALGAVFLAVTGAEALYADLGHFGAARSAPPG
jgi:K+ transporter